MESWLSKMLEGKGKTSRPPTPKDEGAFGALAPTASAPAAAPAAADPPNTPWGKDRDTSAKRGARGGCCLLPLSGGVARLEEARLLTPKVTAKAEVFRTTEAPASLPHLDSSPESHTPAAAPASVPSPTTEKDEADAKAPAACSPTKAEANRAPAASQVHDPALADAPSMSWWSWGKGESPHDAKAAKEAAEAARGADKKAAEEAAEEAAAEARRAAEAAAATAAVAATEEVMPESVGRWQATSSLLHHNTHRVRISDTRDGRQLTFADVIQLMEHDSAFCLFFSKVLRDSPFEHFFWECPAVNAISVGNTLYEHVTVQAFGFSAASPKNFEAHFTRTKAVVTFQNLGRDAMLVCPCPKEPQDNKHFGHLAAFVRASRGEMQELQIQMWMAVGRTFREYLHTRGRESIWLNTEGAGVPWVHVRLDHRPKYYHHAAYRDPACGEQVPRGAVTGASLGTRTPVDDPPLCCVI